MRNFKTVITFIGTIMAARTAFARVRQARDDGDGLELLDAALNAAVVVTGTIVIIRRMRRGEEEA